MGAEDGAEWQRDGCEARAAEAEPPTEDRGVLDQGCDDDGALAQQDLAQENSGLTPGELFLGLARPGELGCADHGLADKLLCETFFGGLIHGLKILGECWGPPFFRGGFGLLAVCSRPSFRSRSWRASISLECGRWWEAAAQENCPHCVAS